MKAFIGQFDAFEVALTGGKNDEAEKNVAAINDFQRELPDEFHEEERT